jgi:hypothetical protein
MREIAGGFLVGKQHGDVVVREPGGFKTADDLLGLRAGGDETEYGFFGHEFVFRCLRFAS